MGLAELKESKRLMAAFIINIVIFIFEVIAFPLSYMHGGWRNIRFYTVLSNIFVMIACACYVVCTIVNKEKNMPYWVRIMRYMSTTCLALTFVVVLTILVPTAETAQKGLNLLIKAAQPFHHVSCPILSVISFGLLEEGIPSNRDIVIAVIPTIIYAIVLIILNLARVTEGPYIFLKVYKQPVYMTILWFIIIGGAAVLLAYLIKLLTKVKERKKKDEKNSDEDIREDIELV